MTPPAVTPPVLLQVVVYALTCGSCAHQTSSLDRDRTPSAMLAHLLYVHGAEGPPPA